MLYTLHGISTMYSNILTDIHLAHDAGYAGYEILASKLLRFLDQGNQPAELLPIFRDYQIVPVCINALRDVDRVEPGERHLLLNEVERYCSIAAVLNVPTIQLVSFGILKGRPWEEVLELMARNVADIADIGKKYAVRFQLEPIAWSPLHSLSQSLELIRTAGRDNVGMVIDFWHLWAGGETQPEEVASLNPQMIYGVHFCDGKKPAAHDAAWDELSLRSYLPGEGDIPLEEWIAAVRSTGYDGSWSSELLSPKHWEWDLQEIARTNRVLMQKYIQPGQGVVWD